MLHFSFSTVLMALLASCIIATLIAIAFLHENIMTCIGYKFLSLFVGLTLFRLLIPFEFPFTSNILLPNLPSRVISFLRQPRLQFFGVGISLWNLFEIMWVMGIIVNLIYYIRNYRLSKNYIQKYGQEKTDDPRYKEILDSICFKHHKTNLFFIVELPQLDSPALWGLKTPYILLPKGLSIPSDKLHYVLYHEALHCFRRDFVVKGAIHLLSIIYWWNPACIILRKHSHTLLEMYIDGAISQDDPDIVKEYTECLLYIRKATAKNISQTDAHLKENACPLIQPLNSDLKRRTLMLLKKPSSLQKACTNVILALLILCVFIASHLFILEASYEPPEVEQGTMSLTGENTYFIKDDDSGYEFYIDGVYVETVASLDFYPKGIKIYNKEGVLIDET